MKNLLILLVLLTAMAGAYWFGRHGRPDASVRDLPSPSSVQITDETIRVVSGSGGGAIVQQSPDGNIKIEGELTFVPAPPQTPPAPQKQQGAAENTNPATLK